MAGSRSPSPKRGSRPSSPEPFELETALGVNFPIRYGQREDDDNFSLDNPNVPPAIPDPSYHSSQSDDSRAALELSVEGPFSEPPGLTAVPIVIAPESHSVGESPVAAPIPTPPAALPPLPSEPPASLVEKEQKKSRKAGDRKKESKSKTKPEENEQKPLSTPRREGTSGSKSRRKIKRWFDWVPESEFSEPKQLETPAIDTEKNKAARQFVAQERDRNKRKRSADTAEEMPNKAPCLPLPIPGLPVLGDTPMMPFPQQMPAPIPPIPNAFAPSAAAQLPFVPLLGQGAGSQIHPVQPRIALVLSPTGRWLPTLFTPPPDRQPARPQDATSAQEKTLYTLLKKYPSLRARFNSNENNIMHKSCIEQINMLTNWSIEFKKITDQRPF